MDISQWRCNQARQKLMGGPDLTPVRLQTRPSGYMLNGHVDLGADTHPVKREEEMGSDVVQ